MTRDDIIRMAREGGICIDNSILLPASDGEVEALEKFAALIAAAEREACAQLVDELVDHRVPASTYSSTIRARGGE